MGDTTSGDSEMANAFGMPAGEATSQHSASTPPKEESLAPEAEVAPLKEEELKPIESDGAAQKVEPKETNPEVALLQKKAQENHRLLIDSIQAKFDLLKNSRLDDSELRKWFDENPEFAAVANRSKRLKDQFRSLMQRDEAMRTSEEVKQRRASQIDPNVDEINDDESKTMAEDDKPLTRSDFRELLKQFETEKAEAKSVGERQKKLEDYAATRKILDKEFTVFKTTADALYEVNKSVWTYEQALKAADRAMFDTKDVPVNISGQIGMMGSGKEEAVNAANGPIQMFSFEEFSGQKK